MNERKDEVEIVVKDGMPCIVLDYEVNFEIYKISKKKGKIYKITPDFDRCESLPMDCRLSHEDIINSILKYLKERGWEEVDDEKK